MLFLFRNSLIECFVQFRKVIGFFLKSCDIIIDKKFEYVLGNSKNSD